MLKTLSELRTNIGSTIRETQISDLIDTFINLTLAEIHNYHTWTWLRRKQTFATVVDQETYTLDSEIDRLAVVRQISTPTRLEYLPDGRFYRHVPDPENQGSGVPRFYRLWEETGFTAQLSADGTVYVKSSSTSDGSTFTVRLRGRNSSGEVITETLTLNGTTSVTSSTTWDDGGLYSISKSAQTTGTITCYATTGGATLAVLDPEETAPRYKRISLYPVPSSVVTMYVEYYERLRYLVNGADVPQLDHKWIWVVREGALAKAWEYKQNEAASTQHLAVFRDALKTMKREDLANADYVPVIEPRMISWSVVKKYSDSVSNGFPSYAVGA